MTDERGGSWRGEEGEREINKGKKNKYSH